MAQWWERNVVDPGKLPLLVCCVAFLVTFVVTRSITRLIRAGIGPFKNNMSGGVHIHHAVPGIIALITGALLAVGNTNSIVRCIAGALIGIGTSLVLDEFALILHLQDVYWSAEGRLSVEMVSLAFGCMALALVGAAPSGVNDVGSTELSVRLTAIAVVLVTAVALVVCVQKDKFRLALFGIFISPLVWVGALRLARPASRWATRHYDAAKTARAAERMRRLDARWVPLLDRLSDVVAGKPSQP